MKDRFEDETIDTVRMMQLVALLVVWIWALCATAAPLAAPEHAALMSLFDALQCANGAACPRFDAAEACPPAAQPVSTMSYARFRCDQTVLTDQTSTWCVAMTGT